jgi:hypothetical protein
VNIRIYRPTGTNFNSVTILVLEEDCDGLGFSIIDEALPSKVLRFGQVIVRIADGAGKDIFKCGSRG